MSEAWGQTAMEQKLAAHSNFAETAVSNLQQGEAIDVQQLRVDDVEKTTTDSTRDQGNTVEVVETLPSAVVDDGKWDLEDFEKATADSEHQGDAPKVVGQVQDIIVSAEVQTCQHPSLDDRKQAQAEPCQQDTVNDMQFPELGNLSKTTGDSAYQGNAVKAVEQVSEKTAEEPAGQESTVEVVGQPADMLTAEVEILQQVVVDDAQLDLESCTWSPAVSGGRNAAVEVARPLKADTRQALLDSRGWQKEAEDGGQQQLEELKKTAADCTRNDNAVDVVGQTQTEMDRAECDTLRRDVVEDGQHQNIVASTIEDAQVSDMKVEEEQQRNATVDSFPQGSPATATAEAWAATMKMEVAQLQKAAADARQQGEAASTVARTEVTTLKTEVQQLQQALADTKPQVQQLRQALADATQQGNAAMVLAGAETNRLKAEVQHLERVVADVVQRHEVAAVQRHEMATLPPPKPAAPTIDTSWEDAAQRLHSEAVSAMPKHTSSAATHTSSAVSNLPSQAGQSELFQRPQVRKSELTPQSTNLNLQNEMGNHTIFAAWAYNETFQNVTLFIVVVNALWIGVDTEWNHKNQADADGKTPLEPFSIIVENAFCAYFFVEVTIRFLAFRNKLLFWKDKWFLFDGVLVFAMVLETWVLEIVLYFTKGEGGDFFSNFSALRLLRLLRLTRISRLMRRVPELVTLCKGIVSAVKSVCWVFFFLVMVMYLFGIMFTSIIGEAPSDEFGDMDDGDIPESAKYMFGTLGDAMMSLFTLGVLGDNMWPTWFALIQWRHHTFQSYLVQWLYFVFFSISSLTLLNMLVGVLCEVITNTAEREKEPLILNELQLCMEDAFNELDHNQDGCLTHEEFKKIKNSIGFRQLFERLGVEDECCAERIDRMEEVLFDSQFGMVREAGTGIPLQHLIRRMHDIRPDKEASALEVLLLKNQVVAQDKWLRRRMINIENSVAKICRRRGVNMQEFMQETGSNRPRKKSKELPKRDRSKPRQRTPTALDRLQRAALSERSIGPQLTFPSERHEEHFKQDEGAKTPPMLMSSTLSLVHNRMQKMEASDRLAQHQNAASIRPDAADTMPNLKDVSIEQLVQVLRSRDPALLKGLPLNIIGGTNRNDQWNGPSPELLT